MNHEAEPSNAGGQHVEPPVEEDDVELDFTDVEVDAEEEAREREQRAKERRLDAKRKRILFLDHLLRELDCLVFVELVVLYYLDCSFFWFAVRALFHVTMLTPLPDLQLHRQHDEHKAFLPVILLTFVVNFILHLAFKAPSAGEETRGYLHGGMMIDFIGQQGPTSKWKLVSLDMAIMVLQLVMVSVLVKKRELKKKLAKILGGTPTSTAPEGDTAPPAEETNAATQIPADREQDADSEERGLPRRSDTLSDAGASPEEEEVLLSTSSDSGPTDALDALSSGQCIVGEFSLIDTLIQEHADYQIWRQTRSETASASSLSPDALRQLHSIRLRFGVGSGG